MSELPLPSIAYLCVAFIAAAVYAFRRGKPGTWLRRLRVPFVALAIWVWAFSTPRITNAIERSLEAPYPPVRDPEKADNTLIFVLSSGIVANRHGTYECELDRAGWERTYAGIRLWKTIGGDIRFVGQPAKTCSVAETMANVARMSGIPETAISFEPKSRTTRENIAFSRDIIASHRDHVWLVTSAMHMRRAMAVAAAEDVEMKPYPCDYQGTEFEYLHSWLPSNGGAEQFTAVWHEIIGLFWYRLRGYAD